MFFRSCSLIFDIDEQLLISEYNKMHLQERQRTAGDAQHQRHNQHGAAVRSAPIKTLSPDPVHKKRGAVYLTSDRCPLRVAAPAVR